MHSDCERSHRLPQTLNEKSDRLADFEQVKQDVDRLVEGLEIDQLAHRIEDFGRRNPIGLAVGSLVLGLAAGLLIHAGQSRKPVPMPAKH